MRSPRICRRALLIGHLKANPKSKDAGRKCAEESAAFEGKARSAAKPTRTNRIGRDLRVATPPAERFNTFESHPIIPLQLKIRSPSSATPLSPHPSRPDTPSHPNIILKRHLHFTSPFATSSIASLRRQTRASRLASRYPDTYITPS